MAGSRPACISSGPTRTSTSPTSGCGSPPRCGCGPSTPEPRGPGSRWPGMGQEWLAAEPQFEIAVQTLDPLFRARIGTSLTELLLGQSDGLFAQQLALFGLQLALAGLWRAHGVEPAAVVGNSM